jgi:hypothetical protein
MNCHLSQSPEDNCLSFVDRISSIVDVVAKSLAPFELRVVTINCNPNSLEEV